MNQIIARALLGLLLAAAAGPDAAAQQSSVVTFDQGSFGWSWNGSGWIEATGGSPGAFLHGQLRGPDYWAMAVNSSSFVGNYAAGRLTSLGIDLAVFDDDHAGPLTLWLHNDNHTPQSSDDWAAYHVSPFPIPTPEEGWRSYDLAIPSQAPSLPDGWTLWHTTDRTWPELMQDVTGVFFVLGDPTGIGFEQSWDVGMDNARWSAGEPGRVPPDITLARVPPNRVQVAWSAPEGCGAPEDYGIYEGKLGDWDSHTAVVCSDETGDRNETITSGLGNRYYLVVPLGSVAEGSYGLDSQGHERSPALAVRCRPTQSLACP
jgi:hypothetical protein